MKPYWFKSLAAAGGARLMRVGFNLHPAFRATGGRVMLVSPDFQHIRIKLPLLRRTRNIVGSMYGGSLFAVTDGAHPTMLMAALGADHVVWDKAASIRYRKPAYATLYADFRLPTGEIAEIRRIPARQHETTRDYTVEPKDKRRRRLCRRGAHDLHRVDKAFYKQKNTGGDKCPVPRRTIRRPESRRWRPAWPPAPLPAADLQIAGVSVPATVSSGAGRRWCSTAPACARKSSSRSMWPRCTPPKKAATRPR